jgi:low affinity Fe/Cu permease
MAHLGRGIRSATPTAHVDRWTKEADVKRRSLTGVIAVAGHRVSTRVADAAAQPLSQAAILAFCVVWWTAGLPTDELTATLSILAITLTQMVLNRQAIRERDDRRRDIAMHAKLDELLRSETYARKELAGIEELEAEEIAALKLRLASASGHL